MHQSPIFGSRLIISLSHPTPVGLVWREFRVLSLDQWVLGNGQVSILDQFRCGFDAPESNIWLWVDSQSELLYSSRFDLV